MSPGADLVVDGEVAAVAVEVATTRRARRRGLLGRAGFGGVLVLEPCRQVHTVGMRFPIDVAFCRSDGAVLRVASMPPGRITRPVLRARFALEAPAGLLGVLGVRPGTVVAVREHAGRGP